MAPVKRSSTSVFVAGVAGAALLATALVPGVGAFAAGVGALAAATFAPATDYTQFVDPFTSTEDDYGQDIPGALAPSGLAKVNPMTTPGRSHSGYDYAEDQIAGFTQTNLDGVGGSGGGGDLLVVPTYVKYTTRPATNSYAKDYSHTDEDATPGYYRVALTTTQGTDGAISNTAGSAPIEAQMTADVRTALQQYTFPNAGTASLVLDLRNNFTGRLDSSLNVGQLPDGRKSFSGFVAGTFNGANYRLYYYSETTGAVKNVRTWGGDGALAATTQRQGADVGAIIDFDVAAGGDVELRTTISPISAEQAKTDMGVEMGGRDFDAVRADTKTAWNDLLGTVAVDSSVVSDPDGTLKQLFYTHLYRLFGSPVNATSTSGTYRGVDGVVYEADGYTHYDSWGLWDDFRKQSILAIAYPEIYRDVTQSLVDLFASFANSGAGSVGSLEQSVPSVRFERASVVIADAVSKGVDLKGLDLAYAGLKKHVGGGYNADNTARGYLADDMGNTLGTAYDDWSMSVIADSLGNSADAAFYLDRATNYTNLFNKDAWTNPSGDKVGLIYPKDANGNWWNGVNLEQFQAANLYQGTPWQYNWYAANDMGGMIEMMGGEKNAQSAVSYLFGEQAPDEGSRMLHSNANEIDLQAPYLFNYVGKPSSTQYWTRSIYTKATWNRYIATDSTGDAPSSGGEFRPPIKDKVFELDSDGFLPTMDNDTGMMSGTFVAAAMGLFPVTAGADSYQIGSPFFESVAISQQGGKSFTINADGVSPDDFYIQSASLNGESLDRTWITYDEIAAGGNVTFQMGGKASDWAADGPMAYSMSDHVDSSVYDIDGSNPVSRSTIVFTEADANDGTFDDAITLTLATGSFAGADGADLSAAITAKNVPAGLALTAVKTSATTARLSLSGTARDHLKSDGIRNLTVTLAPAAFATAISGAAQSFDLSVEFAGYTLHAASTRVSADEHGTVDSSTELTLQGGASFAGVDGSDLLANGGASVIGLPAGLAAKLLRTDATSLTLEMTGKLADVAATTFSIAFDDDAFTGGVTAAQLTGDGIGALTPFTVSIGADWRTKLAALYADAHLVKQGNYSPASFAVLTAAVGKAKALLDNADATEVAMQQSYFTLNSALDGLLLGEGGYRVLEGERSDSWSAGELKNESINLGGVTNGSWVGYSGMDFSEGLPTGIDIRYVANSSRGPADSRVEIHVNAPDGPLAATVALPRSGSDWNAWTTISQAFTSNDAFTGATSVYFVFRGSTTADLPWVANLDSFRFTRGTPPVDAPVTFTKILSTAATSQSGIDVSKGLFENLNNGDSAFYRAYDFGRAGADSIQINYDKPSSRAPEKTAVEIRFGSLTGPVVATVPLTYTGSGWGTPATLTGKLDPAVFTGVKDVYFVFTAEGATSALPYVANVNWMLFGLTPKDAVTSYRLQAEAFAAKSAELDTETSTAPDGVSYVNLKGTRDKSALRYDNVDFGAKTATSVTVRYVNNSARCGTNSRVEVRLDSATAPLFATVPLPVTGNAWSAISTTTFALPSGITGKHSLYLVLRTDEDANHPYVANIDWFDFGYGVDVSPLRTAVADRAPLTEQADRYLAADFRTFTTAYQNAVAALANTGLTTDAMNSALRALNLAANQLEWKVIRQLPELVAQVAALTPEKYTPESYGPVADALAAARAVAAGSSFETYTAAYDGLSTARSGLVPVASDDVAPVLTVPTANTVELGTAFDPMAGVSATDDIDGDLTAAVSVVGSVDTATQGQYPLVYSVSDAAGNVATARRVVAVVASSAQSVQVTIVAAAEGEFGWSIDGTNALVDLGTATESGDHYAAVGTINPIRVTDTRAAGPEWSISAQVSDFTSGDKSFSGKYLGWTPTVVEAGGGAVAGAKVKSGFEGGDGLSAASTLGSAATGHARGSAKLGAGLDLQIPADATDGTYKATVTLTALS